MIPRWAVAAFIRDDDLLVADGEGVVEVGADFTDCPLGAVDGELSAKCVMNGMQRLDNEITRTCAILWIKPEFLHGEVGGIGCVCLGFVGESFAKCGMIATTAKECSDMPGGTRELGGIKHSVFHPVLPQPNATVTGKIKVLHFDTVSRGDHVWTTLEFVGILED